jgi:quercetin dioxygenase-like cupin family protein
MDYYENCIEKLVSKTWGYEKIIVNKQEYCGKILHIVKGCSTSWHFHKLKDETFYVQSGSVTLTYEKHGHNAPLEPLEITLDAGECFHIPPNTKHKLAANVDSEVFEISTQHFDDDSYRIHPS